MNNMLLDWLTYLITAVIVLSILLEGKTTRYPSLFFYGSLLLLGLLLVVAGANWWFYHSAYGLVIVLFTLLSLVCTRFRLVIYACRFKNIVKQITKYTEQGHRVIMVLPEPGRRKEYPVGTTQSGSSGRKVTLHAVCLRPRIRQYFKTNFGTEYN